MPIVSNIIYAITDIHCSLQITQSVVALRVLPTSKCFWYNVVIQRSGWATLIFATKLLYTSAPRKSLFKTDEVENAIFLRLSINAHRKQSFFVFQGRGANNPSFRGRKFSWNFILWRHRAYSTVVQLFRRRSHIIIMYFCLQTRSPYYMHTPSAQRWLIKTDNTERFTTALEAESPVSSEISGFTPYAHAQSNIQHIKYAEKTDD